MICTGCGSCCVQENVKAGMERYIAVLDAFGNHHPDC
jgi:uncharacterized cysteine cluster protein YcgN (CxxCxxCC family)